VARPSVFSRRLKEARQAKQLSQRNLGIAAGIDAFVASARINRYEKGVHLPDLVTAQRIAEVLQTPLPYFFAEEEGMAQAILRYPRFTPDNSD